jgi:hypothetical protein
MFELKVMKRNDEIHVDLDGNFSVTQIDIAMKDLCIQLKRESNNPEKYVSNSDGFFNVSVRPCERELTNDENTYVNMRIMPINEVSIQTEGLSFEEIQHLMNNIYDQMPSHFKSGFMYSVNFLELTTE